MDERVVFYETEAGASPIATFLASLPHDRARENCVAFMQELAILGPPLPRGHAEHYEGEIWELRPGYRRETYRIFYARLSGDRYIMLHALKKKRDRLPRREYNLAVERLADYRRRYPK